MKAKDIKEITGIGMQAVETYQKAMKQLCEFEKQLSFYLTTKDTEAEEALNPYEIMLHTVGNRIDNAHEISTILSDFASIILTCRRLEAKK